MADLSLVMDAGGTTCRLALAQGGQMVAGSRADVPTRGDPVAVCAAYLAGRPLAGAVLAGAGPVLHGRLSLTNADFVLDAAQLQATLGAPVHLVNDLVAQAHGLDSLPGDAGDLLLPGLAVPGAPRLIAGIGTGLNAAVLHGAGATLRVPPSEAGQTAMPALPALAGFRGPTGARPVAEDLISGPGLARLHLHLTGQALSPADVIAAGHGPTLEIWAEALGAWLADLALVHLAQGGLWLAGGVAAATAPHMPRHALQRGLHRAGAFKALLSGLPVRVISDDDLALRGAAALTG